MNKKTKVIENKQIYIYNLYDVYKFGNIMTKVFVGHKLTQTSQQQRSTMHNLHSSTILFY